MWKMHTRVCVCVCVCVCVYSNQYDCVWTKWKLQKQYAVFAGISILLVHLLIQTQFHYLPESIAIVLIGEYVCLSVL